ncbi:MAG: hypothetical protein RIR51_1812 [Bacteroidota bacterium]|jgi:hypothetical protein
MKEIFESNFANCHTFELFEDNNAIMSFNIHDIQLWDKDLTYLEQYIEI